MNKIISFAMNLKSIYLKLKHTWTQFCEEEVEIFVYVSALIIIVLMMVIAFFIGGILIILR